jgi:hypothetical protein
VSLRSAFTEGSNSSRAGEDSQIEAASRDHAASESLAMIHPVAASAILAAGSVLSRRKQSNWEERVDDSIVQWEHLKLSTKSETRSADN